MRCRACNILLNDKQNQKDPNGEYLDLCGPCKGPSDTILALADDGLEYYDLERDYVHGQSTYQQMGVTSPKAEYISTYFHSKGR